MSCLSALITVERTYGADHAEVAKVLVNLGNVYGDLGDLNRKRELVERALASRERAVGLA